MRLDRFDLNLLVVLDVLLEERNVTRASQRLHLGQSGASAALNRLRDYFGDELLVPVGRQLTLTPLARSLVQPVREALLQVRATLARRTELDLAKVERRFVVCASDYVTTVLLADAAQQIARLAPHVALDIRSPPKDLGEAMDRGAIDLLVIPQQYATPLAHPQQALFEDTQVCLVWAENASVGAELSLASYLALGHVAVRFGDERSVSFEEWFLPRGGRQRRIECSVDNFSTLPLLVVGTQRVATVHRRLARHMAQWLPLRLVEPPFDMPALVETLAWPRHLQDDPVHRWVREQVVAQAALLAMPPPAQPVAPPASD